MYEVVKNIGFWVRMPKFNPTSSTVIYSKCSESLWAFNEITHIKCLLEQRQSASKRSISVYENCCYLMIEVRPKPSTWWLICRNPFFNQIFVHLVIDHRAAEGNLEDGFTDKETAPERGCPEWQKSPGWFGIRSVWWKSCNLAAELWKADPRCVSVPGQLWVQMKKTQLLPPKQQEGRKQLPSSWIAFPRCINLLKHDGSHIRFGNYLSLQFIHWAISITLRAAWMQ